ncbi:MAG: hypothetical protein ACI9FR_002295 [Cryomorphaceae bacterium]
MAARYNGDFDTARVSLDLAYAMKMKALAEKYRGDDDAAAMFAEALMNTMPWDYWSDDGSPRDDTVLVIDSLEKLLLEV